MPSTFTPSKGLEEPAAGDYVNAWAPVVNANWTALDQALGGTTSINVTGVANGTYALTLTQYRPINIEFTGALSAALNYQLPTGIGGLWTVSNGTTGGFNLSFSINGGNSILLTNRALIVSDGTNLALAQNVVTAFNQLTGQVSPAQVPVGAVTQWNTALSILMTQVSGALPLGQLPAAAYRSALGSGNVTVQSGGSPSGGSSGDLFLIY